MPLKASGSWDRPFVVKGQVDHSSSSCGAYCCHGHVHSRRRGSQKFPACWKWSCRDLTTSCATPTPASDGQYPAAAHEHPYPGVSRGKPGGAPASRLGREPAQRRRPKRPIGADGVFQRNQGELKRMLLGPDGIRSERARDILTLCRILENIPTPMSHFKQQTRTDWALFSVQTTARHASSKPDNDAQLRPARQTEPEQSGWKAGSLTAALRLGEVDLHMNLASGQDRPQSPAFAAVQPHDCRRAGRPAAAMRTACMCPLSGKEGCETMRRPASGVWEIYVPADPDGIPLGTHVMAPLGDVLYRGIVVEPRGDVRARPRV